MITRKVLALIVAAGLVPAVAAGTAIGLMVATASDRLRSAFAVRIEWEGCGEE